MKKNQNFYIYLFLTPALIIFLSFYLVPIVSVFVTSFTKWNGFGTVKFIGFKNYIELFKRPEFLISIKNLVSWSVIAATLHVAFGALIALMLYRKPFGWKFVRSAFMVPMIISGAAWAVIYRFFFNDDFGVLNTLIRFVNPDCHIKWFYESPFAFWAITFTWVFYAVYVTLVVLTDLMAIPKDLHEAAHIEGVTPWQRTRFIDLPLIKNSIGVSMIISITARITMYESISLTSRGGPGDDTMNLPLIVVQGITDMKYGHANTASVIMIIFGVIALFIVNSIFKTNKKRG